MNFPRIGGGQSEARESRQPIRMPDVERKIVFYYVLAVYTTRELPVLKHVPMGSEHFEETSHLDETSYSHCISNDNESILA